MHGQKRQASGKMAIRYASRRSVCRTCPLRGRCLAGTRQRREIERWTDEDVIERHRTRMRLAGEDMMRRRKALAEHPFGTLKCRAGYRHFLVRGFDKVRGEWSLMALCYNFSRVLRIIGPDRWRALLAQRAAKLLSRLVVVLLRTYCRVRRASASLTRTHPSAAAGPRISAIMTFLPSLHAFPPYVADPAFTSGGRAWLRGMECRCRRGGAGGRRGPSVRRIADARPGSGGRLRRRRCRRPSTSARRGSAESRSR